MTPGTRLPQSLACMCRELQEGISKSFQLITHAMHVLFCQQASDVRTYCSTCNCLLDVLAVYLQKVTESFHFRLQSIDEFERLGLPSIPHELAHPTANLYGNLVSTPSFAGMGL